MAGQLKAAKNGIITEQVKQAAEREGIDAGLLRDEIAAGRAVVPVNKVRKGLVPAAIGRVVTTKVNANIGTSSVSSDVGEEIEKMQAAIEAGADAMMDLSTGGDLNAVRDELIGKCSVPFGTVPIYQVIEGRGVEDISHKVILEIAEKQASQGVDFFTIHAGLLREHLPLVGKRVSGIVSRGGALLAKWMLHHGKQNPMYELFDDLCDIMAEYDVCFSLGDGLRPGSIADATDEAQIAELRTLGDLTARAWEKGCQVIVEGPGHVPYNQIEENMKMQQEICHGAPFYVLGPLVTDLGAGYDHITAAIGGCAAAYHGASFLCYVTPREHLGLPDKEDVRHGVVATKIAAHAADVARGLPGAADKDRRLSTARANLDWKEHLEGCLDPVTAKRMYLEACGKSGDEALKKDADFCSMCGKEWCSVRTNKDIRASF